MAKATTIKSVVAIKIDGCNYLGTFIDDNTFQGTTNASMETYVEMRETGQLTTMIIGDRQNLIIYPITEEDQLELDRCESLWALAVKRSGTWVTSQVYGKLVKK